MEPWMEQSLNLINAFHRPFFSIFHLLSPVAPYNGLHTQQTVEEKSRPNKPKGPPSPIVEGSLPPWLQKRAVLTQRADGNIVIMEHNPQKLS
ncbi:unnamed protein product [Somion occarium]|uniref:Uncharacterized protein n=1 Tax=Somion occarium TaxID=3059160 RepID=A0ABP1CIQ5_9APHY